MFKLNLHKILRKNQKRLVSLNSRQVSKFSTLKRPDTFLQYFSNNKQCGDSSTNNDYLLSYKRYLKPQQYAA